MKIRTDHEQVSVDREDSTPSDAGQGDPSLVKLSRSVVEDLTQDHEDNETSKLQQLSGHDGQTLKDKV